MPAKAAFLLGLSALRANESFFLDEEYLLVDALPDQGQVLQLFLRFKFCPTLCLHYLSKDDQLRSFAYGQLRSDLSAGVLPISATNIEHLSQLIAACLQADHGNKLDTLSCHDLSYQQKVILTEFLSGELVDWLHLHLKRKQLEQCAIQDWKSLKGTTAREAQLNFIRKCPESMILHSICLDEHVTSSHALLSVTSKGLTLTRRKFSEQKFWQHKKLLVLEWTQLRRVTASSKAFIAYVSAGGLEDELLLLSQPSPSLKYKFFCKGNRLK